jgi:hypothetical protein
MHRISMPQTRCIESFSVIINTTRPIDNLILAVAIDIADAQIVIALPSISPVARSAVVTVERPYAR